MSNVIKTTVPLTQALVREFFMDKSISFEIDYENSSVKGAPLITYISNLNLPCTIKVADTVGKEERFKLMEAYFKSRVILEDTGIALAAANILLVAKGLDPQAAIDNQFIKCDELLEFVELHSELLLNWLVFFDSLPLFVINSFEDLREFFSVTEGRQTVSDPDFVGRNVVKVMQVTDFVITYLATPSPIQHEVWLEEQFALPIFGGKSLFEFTNDGEDDLMFLMRAMISGAVPLVPEGNVGVIDDTFI